MDILSNRGISIARVVCSLCLDFRQLLQLCKSSDFQNLNKVGFLPSSVQQLVKEGEKDQNSYHIRSNFRIATFLLDRKFN